MKTYLVGGAVRDLLLGRPIHDHDVAFEGDAACFVRQNPGARKVGRDVDVYLLDGVEHMPLRGTLDEDLAARDFTINALALAETGVVHAHPLALRDLADRVLRPASPTALADSPVRAFRAARFAAQFPDFSVHPHTLDQMRAVAHGDGLAGLPAEQVCRETLKALAAPCPGRYLAVLHAGGCLLPWFAELSEAHAVPAGPARYHTGSVLDHVARVMDMAAVLAAREQETAADSRQPDARPARPPMPELVTWMALCHDLGKMTTEADVLPHHYGHEDRGAPLARALGLRLGMPIRFIEAGEAAARLHMRLARHAELRPGTRVDLLLALHVRGLLPAMRLLVLADGTGKGRTTGPDCALRQSEGASPAPDVDATAVSGAESPSVSANDDPLAPYDPPGIPGACLARLETLRQRTEAELAVLLGIKLPPDLRNKGAASGAHLRELRSMALARLDERNGTVND
ncbi:MAG: HD domain-containing protein [Desulfovibrio sp.]|nr:HD domain-containing protein [Desulfovibrio sp.]